MKQLITYWYYRNIELFIIYVGDFEVFCLMIDVISNHHS